MYDNSVTVRANICRGSSVGTQALPVSIAEYTVK